MSFLFLRRGGSGGSANACMYASSLYRTFHYNISLSRYDWNNVEKERKTRNLQYHAMLKNSFKIMIENNNKINNI